MYRRAFFLSTGMAAALLLAAACTASAPGSVSVLNLGVQTDSATGAIMVDAGDTLWNISKRYRLSVRDIIEMNGLTPPYKLARGQRLKLPTPVEYRVRVGDTLRSVANTFGVSIYRLAQTNYLHEPYQMVEGQNLRIPSSLQRQHERPFLPETSTALPRMARDEVVREPLAPLSARSSKPEGKTVLLRSSKREGFVWPVRGKVISAYGPNGGGVYNDGINIAAPRGTPVAAAAAGTVAYVGDDLKSYGNLVLIRHQGGVMTAYGHLASVKVRKGALVQKGQALGTVGSTGTVGTAQLHFEIRRSSTTLDPQQYLG